MDVDRLLRHLNPLIAWLLRSALHPLVSGGLMLLEVTGRRTGRRYWIPLGYQRDGEVITVLVSHAGRKQWWRNYQQPGPVRILLRGQTVAAQARVVPPDSPAFDAAIEGTLRRLPALGSQFGIRYDRRVGLTVSQRRIVAADAAVVSIALGSGDERPVRQLN